MKKPVRPSRDIILHIFTKRVKVKNVIIQHKISYIKTKTRAQSKKRQLTGELGQSREN